MHIGYFVWLIDWLITVVWLIDWLITVVWLIDWLINVGHFSSGICLHQLYSSYLASGTTYIITFA